MKSAFSPSQISLSTGANGTNLQISFALLPVGRGAGASVVNLVVTRPVESLPRESGRPNNDLDLGPAFQEAIKEMRRGLESYGDITGSLKEAYAHFVESEFGKTLEYGDAEAVPEPVEHTDVEGRQKDLREEAPTLEPHRSSTNVHWEHFTKGIVGSENANCFSENLDFDMNALWVAGWFRRGEDERHALIDRMASDDEFQRKFGDEVGVRRWLAAMAIALDGVAKSAGVPNQQAMSLAEITQLVARWNANRDTLRDRDGNALLDALDPASERGLVDRTVDLLMGIHGDNGTVFTESDAVYPEWTTLNLLRYWSGLGREDTPDLVAFGPLTSPDSLEKYIRYHP